MEPDYTDCEENRRIIEMAVKKQRLKKDETLPFEGKLLLPAFDLCHAKMGDLTVHENGIGPSI